MDKFLASLTIMIFTVLVFSSVTMFQSKTSASSIESGVKILLDNSNGRQPAIGSNRE